MEIGWVKIGKIPLDKRCDRNVAYVGGLVGVSLDIDMSTLNRPSSVCAKIGCRNINELPASAEGCLGGRFYRFLYEVEEVLVKNPDCEEKVVLVAKDKSPRADRSVQPNKLTRDYISYPEPSSWRTLPSINVEGIEGRELA